MIDAFPLQDPEASNEEIDTLLQKQFDNLQVLISILKIAFKEIRVHLNSFLSF